MPLRALVDNEDYFAENLCPEDKNRLFQCPFCSDHFIPVIQTVHRIKHFRHRNGYDHWEPETREHLEMKMVIKKEGEALGFKPEVEVPIYAHNGEYIVDILMNDIAIECQCSRIKLDYFMHKNSAYKNLGLKSLWIFGGQWFDNTRRFFLHQRNNKFGFKEYPLQRIGSVERKILGERKWKERIVSEAFGVPIYKRVEITVQKPIFYFGEGTFWLNYFQYRWESTVYGWFKSQETSLGRILNELDRKNP